jgi:hypothetical protein
VFVPDKLFLPCLMFVRKIIAYPKISGFKPTHLTSVFSLRTSILSPPDGTMLTAFTDVITDVADVRYVGFLQPP